MERPPSAYARPFHTLILPHLLPLEAYVLLIRVLPVYEVRVVSLHFGALLVRSGQIDFFSLTSLIAEYEL